MSGFPTFRDLVEASRPSSAPKSETKAIFKIALRFRDQLAGCFERIESASFSLEAAEIDELAVALTELAEDLHCDTGLWRSLEAYHLEFFGVFLPFLGKIDEPMPETFDVRRFQFFLFSVWRHFHPEQVISPKHEGLRVLAQLAGRYFTEAFSAHPRQSSVVAFLSGANRRGWEVKRKLVWLGTRSFLFRFAFKDYIRRRTPEANTEIAVTDDFLCQECTEWSGLGVLDILSSALDLPDADRAVLRGWHERHEAFFRIDSWQIRDSQVETLDAINLINGESYRVRMEVERDDFLATNSAVTYRYCPDRAQRARDFAAEHFADFVRFHGSDLAVFPDGLSAAAAEQKRMRIFSESKAGKNLAEILRKYGKADSSPSMRLPKGFIKSGKGVAVFYHEGEGTEMIEGYDILLSALGNRGDLLSRKELEILQAFIEEDTISPAFVRRVIREEGSAGIERLYFLSDGEADIEYLLRRFKGFYYRKRYPCISLLDE